LLPVIITHEELLLHMGRNDRILGSAPRSICADDDGPQTDPAERDGDNAQPEVVDAPGLSGNGCAVGGVQYCVEWVGESHGQLGTSTLMRGQRVNAVVTVVVHGDDSG